MVKVFDMKRYILLLVFGITILSGCKETTLLRPYGENDGVAPGAVTNVSVRNFSGGATLKYDLPKDLDLAYIKAKYVDSNGQECEAMASAYVDSLVIRGLGEARDYDVKLYSYDKFENASEAVPVVITPTTSPVQLVFESLKCTFDFGGFLIEFENKEMADIGIYITQKNALLNEHEYYDSYFTKKNEGSYSVRGLPSVENEFGVYVQDKWNNRSETLLFTGTPLYEIELDKTKFLEVDYKLVPGDLTKEQEYNGGGSKKSNLWDNIVSTTNYFNTLLDLKFPHRFTIDLGVEAKLSRLKIWQRDGSDVIWKHAMWKRFNVYGCTVLPDRSTQPEDDPMKNWTLLGEFESIKPSGSPLGVETDEDIQLVHDGEEFSFVASNPSIRYIRFEILEAHSAMKSSGMSEIGLWGQVEGNDKTDK